MNATGFLAERFDVLRTVRNNDRGCVLEACDRRSGRQVALKVRDEHAADAAGAEVSVLLRLGTHPGLPVVLEDIRNREDGSRIVVLEWIDGDDLDSMLSARRGGRLPTAEVRDIVSQTSAVLDFLHGQVPAVIHGDVKPSNLMRSREGRMVLVDFDVAGVGSFREPAGSDGYQAPEVASGGSVTPAVDVYGLAATTVRLLTGRPPGRGPLDLPGGLGGSHAGIELALRHGVAVDPLRRTASAGAFAAALGSALGPPPAS